MPVGVDEVRRIAALARIPLSEAEVREMAEQLGAVLAQVEALPGLGENSAPDAASGADRLRTDRPEFDALQRPVEAIAPAWEDGLFVVPRLPALGGGETG